MTGATLATPGAQEAGGGDIQEVGSGPEAGAQGDTGAGAVDQGRDITQYRGLQGADMVMVKRGDTLDTGRGPSQLPRGVGDIGVGQRTRGRWRAGGQEREGP